MTLRLLINLAAGYTTAAIGTGIAADHHYQLEPLIREMDCPPHLEAELRDSSWQIAVVVGLLWPHSWSQYIRYPDIREADISKWTDPKARRSIERMLYIAADF